MKLSHVIGVHLKWSMISTVSIQYALTFHIQVFKNWLLFNYSCTACSFLMNVYRTCMPRKDSRIQINTKTAVYPSHARTVVRECCKGDDKSQWERGKLQNFIQIGLGVSVLRMRDFAPLKWLGYIFLVLEKGYSRDACTDFDAKTSNDAVPRK